MSARFLPILGLIIFGVVSRLLPHPPNFVPLNAMALFSILYFDNRWTALVPLFVTMFVSDLVLGFHTTMPFVYLSFGLIILAGYRFIRNMPIYYLPAAGFASAVFFFLVSNFGAWLTNGLYPSTLTGLGLCYLAALPFFANMLIGDLIYATLLFVSIEVLFSRLCKWQSPR